MILINNIDETMATARTRCLQIIEQAERDFLVSVTKRGVLTPPQVMKVLDEHRPLVLEELDENMKRLRAWILRGGMDAH